MKTKTFLAFALAALLAAEPVFGVGLAIMDVSVGKNNTDEFIVLSNTSDTPFPLDGFRLTQMKSPSCSESTLVPASRFAGKSVPADGTLFIAHPEYAGNDTVDIFYAASYTLTASTMRVSLLDPSGHEAASQKLGTKCNPVEETPPEEEPAEEPAPSTPLSIRLSEVLPNPEAKNDAGEFIELYNAGTEPADISGWALHDASKTGKYTFPAGTLIAASTYFAVTDQDFKLSLNNTDETVSLFDKTGLLVDSMRYESSKEDISLNWTPAGWRGGTPTPGAANILNNLPTTKEKVPRKGYCGMPIAMTAKGKDADKDKLKYTWDFGDGHKSYKAETTHTYEESGEYAVTLKTTDDKDDVIETFTITIRKYEAPDIRIVSFIPNPGGKDTDNEWILIENREKRREIDLLGFGIATGWKSLANHPVRQSFIIPPKSEAKLTRTYSLFTLPNQKGKIELRAPDGTVIQDIKYKLEKSAPDDAIYTKKKGTRWALGPAPQKPSDTKLASVVAGASIEVPEITTPEPAPTMSPEEETPLPFVTRNDLMTKDPHQPRLSDIINLGLHTRLPSTIAYTPHDQILILPTIENAPERIDAGNDFFLWINTKINAWLNEA